MDDWKSFYSDGINALIVHGPSLTNKQKEEAIHNLLKETLAMAAESDKLDKMIMDSEKL